MVNNTLLNSLCVLALFLCCMPNVGADKLVIETCNAPSSNIVAEKNNVTYNNVGTAQDFTSSTWSGGKWQWIWANRCVKPPAKTMSKPNDSLLPPITNPAGYLMRPIFSSIDKANACTKVQVMYALGYNQSEYMAVAAQQNLTVYNYTSLQTGGDKIFKTRYDYSDSTGNTTYYVAENVVPLPGYRLIDAVIPSLARGIVLDYEVADGRNTSETLSFIEDISSVVHNKGKKIILWPNSLDAPSQKYTNLNANNLNAVLNTVDYLSINIWSGNVQPTTNQSLAAQYELLRGPDPRHPLRVMRSKIVVTFGEGNMTLDNARDVHTWVEANNAAGYLIWRNGASSSSDPSYIAALTDTPLP